MQAPQSLVVYPIQGMSLIWSEALVFHMPKPLGTSVLFIFATLRQKGGGDNPLGW